MAQLGRFDYTVQTVLGLAVSGASVAVYREGATVNGAQSGTTPLTVTVRHRGKIVSGDVVFINAAFGTTYVVTGVTATTVTLAAFSGTLFLSSGDRITPAGSQPTLYGDDQAGATTSNPLTTAATGRANCWMEFGAYDFVVSGGGATTTAFTAQVAPSQAPGQIRYADEFKYGSSSGGIIEALNDLPSTGGTVFLSANTTYSTSVIMNIPVDNVRIQGGGQSTIVVQTTNATDGFGLVHNNVTISDLTLRGTNVAGVARGISGGGNTDCIIENCVIEQWGGVQVNFGNTALRNTVRGCIVRNGKNEGVYFGPGCADNMITGNIIYGNAKNGIDVNGSRTIISNNVCRNNGVAPDVTDTCGILVGTSAGNTSTDNVIIGNICDTNVKDGIFIWGGGTVRRFTVANNISRATTNGWGIALSADAGATFDQITVRGNVCDNNGAAGIVVDGLDDSVITGNVCEANGSHGIHLYATSKNCQRNVVVGNITRSNTTSGIRSDNAGNIDCIIEGNHCTGNASNIVIASAVRNTVRNNKFGTADTQNITAAATAIVITDEDMKLTADNNYTLSAAPTIADGYDKQRTIIINVDAVDTITLQDQGTLPASNLRLGAATRALGPRDSIQLQFDSVVGDWVELAFNNVI